MFKEEHSQASVCVFILHARHVAVPSAISPTLICFSTPLATLYKKLNITDIAAPTESGLLAINSLQAIVWHNVK